MLRNKNIISLFVFCGYLSVSHIALAETMEKVVFKTLASNPALLGEFQNRNAIQQQLQQVKSEYYPSVDLLAAVGNENSKNRYTRALYGTDDYVDLNRSEEAIIVTQNLFNGFGTTGEVDRYNYKLEATNHRLHNQSEQTAIDVARVYLSVLRNQELVKISQRNLVIHKELYQKVEKRSRSGVGRSSDLDQADGRLALAQANLISDQTNLRNAQTNYVQVVGYMPNNLVRPSEEITGLPKNLEQAVKSAIDNSPVLKAAEAEVDSAISQRTSSRKGYYPKLDLVFEQSRNENVDGVEEVEKDYSIMLKMKYNLFNGGYDKSRSKEAVYRLNQTRNEQESSRRQVIENMRLAWNSYASVIEQIPYLEKHVDSSTRTRRAYEKQFGIGQRTLLDLLDSENELYQAKRAMIMADYEKQLSSYRVLAAMGQFIDQLEPAVARPAGSKQGGNS
jgi:adhesin transport system outer membrane protein